MLYANNFPAVAARRTAVAAERRSTWAQTQGLYVSAERRAAEWAAYAAAYRAMPHRAERSYERRNRPGVVFTLNNHLRGWATRRPAAARAKAIRAVRPAVYGSTALCGRLYRSSADHLPTAMLYYRTSAARRGGSDFRVENYGGNGNRPEFPGGRAVRLARREYAAARLRAEGAAYARRYGRRYAARLRRLARWYANARVIPAYGYATPSRYWGVRRA